MAQQIIIIGLGQFGMSLARTLSERKAEVLAVDPKKNRVEEAASFVTEAVIMDASDETELSSLNPSKRDAVICAIGDDSRESSIICTALLRQMGVPYIVSRANDRVHERILRLVGAHEIINPEMEFGKKFANKLLYRKEIANSPLGDELNLTEIRAQPYMIGKTLAELELPKKFGAIVVGFRKKISGNIVLPNPNLPLNENDTLVIAVNEDLIPQLIKGK
ncbi:MAG: TrkA family potassium uptake protein [Desulforegulaceae bacterium]|nr:TrkA family potassium uptake protein [Desulforegulaceae bacterium]